MYEIVPRDCAENSIVSIIADWEDDEGDEDGL